MKTIKENYMEKFKTPEEYIRYQILANKGTQNVIDKKQLVHLAEERGIEVQAKMTKEQILQCLEEKISLAEVETYCGHLGVSSYHFQQKFSITHEEVKRMARLGFIHVTGTERFRAYGKYLYADLYSTYEYFALTKEHVEKWLLENPKGTRRKQNGK